MAAIQKTNLCCVSAFPQGHQSLFGNFGPSSDVAILCQDDAYGEILDWLLCCHLTVLCLSSYNAHLLVRHQTFRMQLFSIGENMGELGAEPEEAPWCFSPTITSYLLVHNTPLSPLPASGNGPLPLSQDRLHIPPPAMASRQFLCLGLNTL